MSTTTASHRVKAWITDNHYGPADIKKDGAKAAERLYYSNHDMAAQGWVLAGHGDITLTLVDENTLIDNKVEALRAEARKITADSQARLTRLDRQIRELLALPMSPVTSTEGVGDIPF